MVAKAFVGQSIWHDAPSAARAFSVPRDPPWRDAWESGERETVTIQNSVTELLDEWRGGDVDALRNIIQIVYSRLRRIARAILARRQDLNTLQATELIGEIFQSLLKGPVPKDRSHFLNLAAKMMRDYVHDYAKAKYAQKRGAGRVESADTMESSPCGALSLDRLVCLEEALRSFETEYPRQAKVVELKFFIGLSTNEIGEALKLSPASVKRDWRFAKAWLQTRLRPLSVNSARSCEVEECVI